MGHCTRLKVKASCKNAYIVKESKVFVRTSAAAVEAVDPVLKKGSVKRIQGVVERENPLHDFQHEFSAPVTGITPSTQVGRLSGSHSDIGFQLIHSQVEKGEGTARRESQFT